MIATSSPARAKTPPSQGIFIENLWQAFIKLKPALKANKDRNRLILIDLYTGQFQLNMKKIPHALDPTHYLAIVIGQYQVPKFDNVTICQVSDHDSVHFLQSFLPGEVKDFIKLYLPYLLLQNRQLKRAFSVSHFAQTLDGKIATRTFNSKWIGCHKNLEHAHRMRALCDAVIIGAATLKADQPRLTVRHVPGDHPLRIVIGSSCSDFDCLKKASSEVIMVMGKKKKRDNQLQYLPESIQSLSDLLGYLQAEHGIQSVYIEGGSKLASSFLAEGILDVLQLHIAPKLLGSGVSSFQLDPVDKIINSYHFEKTEFITFGEGVLFSGRPVILPE